MMKLKSARLEELIELHKRYLEEESMPLMIGKTVNVFNRKFKTNGEVSGYTDNYFLVFTKVAMSFLESL